MYSIQKGNGMKKLLKSLLGVVCSISLLLITKSNSYAVTYDELMAKIDVGPSIENIAGFDGIATGYMEKGIVDANQGWVLYGVGSDQKTKVPGINAVFVAKNGQYSYSSCTYGLSQGYCDTRITDERPSYNPVNVVPDSFYWDSHNKGYSNWTNISSNVVNIVNTYWGGTAFAQSFTDNFGKGEEKVPEYYLVMEPVYWHGLHTYNETGTISDAQKKAIDEAIEKFVAELEAEIRKAIEDAQYSLKIGTETQKKEASKLLDNKSHLYINLNGAKAGYGGQLYQEARRAAAGYKYTGETFCGTVYRGAFFEDLRPNIFKGVYSYRHGMYCTFIELSEDFGTAFNIIKKPVKTANISNTDIKKYGYGICAFADTGEGLVIDPPPTDDGYEPVSLYETKHYDHTNTYDLSEAIPSSEYLTNEVNIASFTGDGDFIETKTQNASKTWSASCTYKYTVHDWYRVYDYKETSDKDINESERATYESLGYTVTSSTTGTPPNQVTTYHAHKEWWHYGGDTRDDDPNRMAYTSNQYTIETRPYSFKASLDYQYIKETPHLYAFLNSEVANGSYGIAQYDRNNTVCPALLVSTMELHNTGTGSSTLITSSDPYPATVAYKGSSDHYSWAGNITGTTCDVITLNKGYNHTDETVGHDFQKDINNHENDKVKELAAKIQSATKSRNDSLKINDKKTGLLTVCNDSWAVGCTVYAYKTSAITDSTPLYNTYSGNDAAKQYGYSGIIGNVNDSLLASRVSGSQVFQIPYNKENGDYPTGMTVNYLNIYDDTSIYTLKAGATVGSPESIYKHVMRDGILPHHTGTLGGDEADGYPVRVHTPVESPIKIVDYNKSEVNEANQLVSGSSLNTSVDNQLLLDKKYYVSWDNESWISAVYGETPSGYENIFDSYVTAKYLQFPFAVVYNGRNYNINADGYTDWIKVVTPSDKSTPWSHGVNVLNYESANHWQMTPFYIPTYAIECGTPEEEVWINAKVEAINAGTFIDGKDTKTSIYMIDSHTREYLDNLDGYDDGLSINGQKANYIAICDRKIQLSGWVYDFTIVGRTNGAVLDGATLPDVDPYENTYPLAQMKEEVKTGLYNRLGHQYLRYLTDGTITTDWDSHLFLPLQQGSSFTWNKMGEIWRGENFAFTVKTIGSFNTMYDSIEITPSYTYVKKDGTIVTGDDLVYMERDPITSSTQIVDVAHIYDPTDTSLSSKWVKTQKLADRMFRNSFYEADDVTAYNYADWVTRSVANENSLTSPLVALDNNAYQYREVPTWTINHISLPASMRYISGEYEQLEMNESKEGATVSKYSFNNYTALEEEVFKKSMQQWQGEFGIPQYVKLLDITGQPKKDIVTLLNDITEDKGGYFRWDEEPFEPFEGYLIIHFDIIVNKAYCEDCGHFCDDNCGCETAGHHISSKPYLQYDGAGGGLDMWATQGYNDHNGYLPIEEGDVAVVDLSRSMSHYYEVGIMNIN